MYACQIYKARASIPDICETLINPEKYPKTLFDPI
jgi:hypothetical protein